MEKEILTLQTVQNEVQYKLRRSIKGSYIGIAITFVFFVPFLLLCIVSVEMKDSLGYILKTAILPAACLLLIILGVANIVTCHTLLRDEVVVVKDYLVGKEIYSYRRHVSFMFTFGRYGAFSIPKENYTWSKLHCKTDDMVYNGSKCDDEFYLVLSKRDPGRIFSVYNTKLFEYQE